MRTPVPEAEYRAAEAELQRTADDLRAADHDRYVAAQDRALWEYRAEKLMDDFPEADLESVRAFCLWSTAERRFIALREQLDSQRWRFDRISIAEVEAAEEPETVEEPAAVQVTPAADRALTDLRRSVRRPKEYGTRKVDLPTFCQVEGCDLRAAKGGHCMSHMPRKEKVPRQKRREDGMCHFGCGRDARERRAACAPCGDVGRFIGSCATCGKPARADDGVHCRRHAKQSAAT